MPAQFNSLPICLSREARTFPHSPHGTCNSYPNWKEVQKIFFFPPSWHQPFWFLLSKCFAWGQFCPNPAFIALSFPWREFFWQSSPSCIKLKSLSKVVISTSPTYVIRTMRISTPSTSTRTALENGREETAGMRGAKMFLICRDWCIREAQI